MRIASSSFVFATLVFSPALAAPTPTMPYDSPVPGSPRMDDWTESVRSPRIPRSPMLPAIRVAGRRRSIPHFRRQEEVAPPPDEDTDTASAQGLFDGLGDTLSGILHGLGDVAGGLPVIGGLGILSTDGSNPGSPPPPQKRDDAERAPDADAEPAPQGLLGGLGDALDDALYQVSDVANVLPIVSDLQILSTDGPSPQKRDDVAPDAAPAPGADPVMDPAAPAPDSDKASAQGLLGGLGDTLSGVLHGLGDATSDLPIVGGIGILSMDGSDSSAAPQRRDGSQGLPMPVDELNALRQQVATLLLQQQQAEQAAATLSAASSSLPVNAADLQQRLLALQSTAQGVTGGLNLQGLLGGLPVTGTLLSNSISNDPLSTGGGVAGGLLSAARGTAGGLPVVGGILGANGLVGGQGGPGDVTGIVGNLVGAVTGTAGGMLGGVAGDNGIFQNVLSGGSTATSQAFASTNQMHWPDASGLYPHALVNGAPVAPPNSPAPAPSSIVYGSLGMDGSGAPPAVPPPSPVSSAGSVPMDHDTASSFMVNSPADMTGTIPALSFAPSMDTLTPRRVDEDVVGETPSQVQPNDHADGFSPSMPDADYTPPLLTVSKRSDVHGVAESDMHEGGPDAVPGPQDRISGTSKAPRQVRMFRRLLRGASVSF